MRRIEFQDFVNFHLGKVITLTIQDGVMHSTELFELILFNEGEEGYGDNKEQQERKHGR